MKNRVLIFILFTFLFSFCAVKTGKIDPKQLEEEKPFQLLKEKGDKEFDKMYWAGWKNAIDFYEGALQIKNDNNVKQKLFYSLLLISIREKIFELRNYNYLKRAKELLPGIDNEYNEMYLQISREMVDERFLSEKYKSPRSINYKTFQKNLNLISGNINSDYLYFFYIEYLGIHLRTGHFEQYKRALKQYKGAREEFSKKYSYSNLRIVYGSGISDIEKKLKKYPDYIELILIYADQLYRRGNFLEAEAKYREILKINPWLAAAITGLGNIYFWLELYNDALPYYEDALSINPCFSKALFGKAVCLHYIGDYETSNQILSEMFEKQVLYYGEIYYYTALNNYFLEKYSEIEKNIKNAELYIPDSIELNIFAGIYYYHSKKIKEAENYFKKVLEQDDQYADSYFYLGLIDLKRRKEKNALKMFLLAARYFLEDINRIKKKLLEIKNLNISEKHKERRKHKLNKLLKSTIKKNMEYLSKIMIIYKKRKKSKIRQIKIILNEIESKYRMHNPA